ncbi:MAG: methyltransferase domain-containing protein, partial [Nitratireductor sp.]|nr:methyltransferase domain-containing protein [Nitratireductor sp.]
DFLAAQTASDLEERLSTIERRFPHAVLVHCRTDHAGKALERSGKVDTFDTLEAHAALPGHRAGGKISSDETLPLDESRYDLAVSLLSLHETNDTPGQLVQMRRALKPDGLFIGAFPGSGTLSELRESLLAAEMELTGGASPRVYPFADVRAAGALLQRAGFALPVADSETYTVRYDSMFALLRDLRAMGATSALAARSRTPATKALFARAAEIYAERFSDLDGRVRATFTIVWMSGWVPHESQQKPLKPGSASHSLAQALRTAEDPDDGVS